MPSAVSVVEVRVGAGVRVTVEVGIRVIRVLVRSVYTPARCLLLYRDVTIAQHLRHEQRLGRAGSAVGCLVQRRQQQRRRDGRVVDHQGGSDVIA